MNNLFYQNMKTGITFSAFDLFHAGHVKMLEEAKRQCEYLIVGLQTDPTIDRPEKKKAHAKCSGTVHPVERL
jgi:glycerol-3-phosphate cytidylyltransferase